ncbi:MAG: hypothetical protein EZS28_029844, partial [Streblomastix strix]
MHFVLLLSVSAVLCVDFVPPPHVRSAEQESAFKDNNINSIAANILSIPSGFTSLNPCDGYEITLVDSEHFESVQINKSQAFPVLIKGGAKDEEQTEIHTIWGVNTYQPRTVTLLQGDLTISNIEFIYFESTDEKQDEQDEVIWPWNAIIYAYDPNFSNRKLSLESCIFKGL